ncbi:MAG TPA: arylsulfatase, partial [Mycobacteriales bacterium]|nr:arylsulfatase [Mycobacteriales bacterium]
MKPNIVLILADDMGYSDIGCYGGEIPTPNLDRLAAAGVRMSQFYNTARCSPSRASLLTGLHPHQTGIGILTSDDRPFGYPGTLNDRCVTMAEILGGAGYGTYLSGKWHLTGSFHEVHDSWPTRRGFQRFFGTICGGGSYYWPKTLTRDETPIPESEMDPDWYYTDAIGSTAAEFITDHQASRPDDPLFLYTAFTAPHWPLHAPEDEVEAQGDRYSAGWDELRGQRIERQREMGLFEGSWAPSDRDSRVPAWDAVADHDWQARRMAVYAAQVARMDRNIGRIVDALESAGRLENTLIMFLSDNGGCAEGQPYGQVVDNGSLPEFIRAQTRDGEPVMRGNRSDITPGADTTYSSYGTAWANLSNTPFREYKHWVHEGGISTPLVVHWPAGGFETGAIRHNPHQLPDVLATVLEVTGVDHPSDFGGRERLSPQGTSMLAAWRGEGTPEHDLYWEHEGNSAMRRGQWKLVRKFPGDWELYDLAADRAELTDLAGAHPQRVAEMVAAYQKWAGANGVVPREEIVANYERLGRGGAWSD